MVGPEMLSTFVYPLPLLGKLCEISPLTVHVQHTPSHALIKVWGGNG